MRRPAVTATDQTPDQATAPAAAAPSRRRFAAVALAFAAAAAAAPARADVTGGLPNRRYDGRGKAKLRALSADRGRFRPRALLVLSPEGGFRAELPHVAAVLGVDRLPAAKLPLVGRLFGDIPAANFVRPERRIGVLYRAGDDLVADLRRRPRGLGRETGDYLRQTIVLLTDLTDFGVVELGLPGDLNFRPVSAKAPGALTRIGGAYDAGGRLLLSPPYDSLFGARLF